MPQNNKQSQMNSWIPAHKQKKGRERRVKASGLLEVVDDEGKPLRVGWENNTGDEVKRVLI
ncbi:Hypothetical protein FKW44_016999 [Caligus rogercresseyi]|uniref:Uncharacterized protein n=1 Tax=Caligus rogercresseyi TaxID=217165 RepID=A0A7T8H2R5_CALRO|nr:Hypothetical protein FKW44_016999 [Caligus rogercresseyi]